MTTNTYHLKLITPCFCAGANQAIAEIRAPSIRGKLRWWFRVLGATALQEAEVFGSVAGGDGTGSAVIVRVRVDGLAERWQPIEFGPTSNQGYVLYFAKASANGARWTTAGALPAGSGFEILLTSRRKLPIGTQDLFDCALKAFLFLGSLGLRSSRGLGCFACKELPFSTEALGSIRQRIQKHAPEFLADLGDFQGTPENLLNGLGGQLRGLRAGYSAGAPGRSHPTPLGSSQPRQASAVHLRPVVDQDGTCRIVVFEAPAERVLGQASRRGAPRLKDGVPPPAAPPQGRRAGNGGHYR